MQVLDVKAWFAKQNRSVTVDGVRAPWLVVVEGPSEASSGNYLRVSRTDGSRVLVKLRTEVPYADKKNPNHRFSFDSVNEHGSLDDHSSEQYGLHSVEG